MCMSINARAKAVHVIYVHADGDKSASGSHSSAVLLWDVSANAITKACNLEPNTWAIQGFIM